MKKQYILFDFDGVIVNTEPQNAHYLQKTLKSFGIYMNHEDLKGFIGVNSREKILHYLSRSKENVSWEMYQKRRKEMGNTYENDAICPMPGLQELFQWMKGRNLKAGLVNINEREIYYYGFKPDQNDRLFFSYCMWGYVRKKKALSGWVLKGDTVIAG